MATLPRCNCARSPLDRGGGKTYNRVPRGEGQIVPDASDAIVEALRSVYDPCCAERGISIVDMGLIESVDVEGENARVELVLTSGWCPFSVDLLTTVRERLEELGINDPTVEIRWDRGWSSDRMDRGARAKLRLLPDPHLVKDRDRYVEGHLAAGAMKGGREP